MFKNWITILVLVLNIIEGGGVGGLHDHLLRKRNFTLMKSFKN